jgi:hypothetical protein
LPLVLQRASETVKAEVILPGLSGPQLQNQRTIDSCAPNSGTLTIELRDLGGKLVVEGRVTVTEGCLPAAEALAQLYPVDLCGGVLRRVGPLSAEDGKTSLEVSVDGSSAAVGLTQLPLQAGQTLTIRPRALGENVAAPKRQFAIGRALRARE